MIYRKTFALLASVFVVLMTNITNAQTSVYQDENFRYFECNQIVQDVPEEIVDSLYATIITAIGLYNGKTTGIQMVEPERNFCFLSLGKESTEAAGWRNILFFTSQQHFICFVNGSCEGNLVGYYAGVSVGRDIQFFVNTGSSEDAVSICSRGGNFELGSCS